MAITSTIFDARHPDYLSDQTDWTFYRETFEGGKYYRDKYLEIITSKTGELMSAACASGAMVSGVDKYKIDNLKGYGLNLGIAFQLVDDLLDYISSEEKFGKPVGKDLMEGKITLPLIYAISEMDKKELLRVKKIFHNTFLLLDM